MNTKSKFSRTTGGKAAGSLKKGCALYALQDMTGSTPQHKFTSIPSKYETLLNVGQKERDAFGGRTHRFKSSVNDLPGPGSYSNNKNLAMSTRQNPSFSKKGMGCMPNNEKRWYELPGPSFNPPGPGSYYAPSFVDSSNKKSFNRKHGTAAFAVSDSKPLASLATKNQRTPGPGDYQSFKSSFQPNSKSSSVFASKTLRQPKIPSTSQPHQSSQPNYAMSANVPSASKSYKRTKPKEKFVRHDEMLPSSVFRSNSHRVPPSHSIAPGPGYYQADLNTDEHQTQHGPAPSSMFASTGKLDRFGKPMFRYTRHYDTPGPGAYGSRIGKRVRKKKRSQAIFRSKTDRFGKKYNDERDYNPEKASSKSFHFNKSGSWV